MFFCDLSILNEPAKMTADALKRWPTQPTKSYIPPASKQNTTQFNHINQLKIEKNPKEGKQTLKQADLTTNLSAPGYLHSWAPTEDKLTGSALSLGWIAVVCSSKKRKIKGKDVLPIHWYHLWQGQLNLTSKGAHPCFIVCTLKYKISVCPHISNFCRKGKGY